MIRNVSYLLQLEKQTGKQTGQYGFFYRILDSSIINAYAILVINDPNFGGKTNDKRVYFMKEVAKLLIISYAQRRFESKRTPKKVMLVMETFGVIKCSNETVESQD